MTRILCFIACAGFAMPAYAETLKIGQPVTVPVIVNVENIGKLDIGPNGLFNVEGYGICQVETISEEDGRPLIRGYCNDDEPVKMAGDETMMIYY